MKVRHLGNTANNAYYNARILEQFERVESELPIRMFGLAHAISAPAWESVEFDVPDAAWVSRPDWSMIPGAIEVDSEYTDLAEPAEQGAAGGSRRRAPGTAAVAAGRAVLRTLYGRKWAEPLFDVPYGLVLARRPVLAERPDTIDVLYGADSISRVKVSAAASHYVCLEHGTVRWIGDGSRELAAFRRAYRTQVAQAAQLWVTNLDPRTLEIAEDVAPGRWTALPHPYLPDARVPFAESKVRRQQLLTETASQYLILLPSSQNWAKTHDKGSMTALRAFVELQRRGLDVGLVAVEWGLQLAESKEFLARSGVGDKVAWVPPMARFGLQRMMANVDVVWDQFGLEAFGGLACRAVEQGTPFVSRGLAPVGEQLIGGSVPWLQAANAEEIVRQTESVLGDVAERGRIVVVADHRARYRAWLFDRHSPALTAALQNEVYSPIVDGGFQRGTAAPDRWAKRLAVELGGGG